jgi:hypothetical protein
LEYEPPTSLQNESPIKEMKAVPRIFFATHTHTQIAQIVKELRSTPYRPKMSILGGRDHYCIHETISTKPNKNEEWFDAQSNHPNNLAPESWQSTVVATSRT